MRGSLRLTPALLVATALVVFVAVAGQVASEAAPELFVIAAAFGSLVATVALALDRRRERPRGFAPPRRVPRARERCPFCHDGLSPAELLACEGCGAIYHPECVREAGRCATLGCAAGRERVSA